MHLKNRFRVNVSDVIQNKVILFGAFQFDFPRFPEYFEHVAAALVLADLPLLDALAAHPQGVAAKRAAEEVRDHVEKPNQLKAHVVSNAHFAALNE